jgi:hypothetical protein
VLRLSPERGDLSPVQASSTEGFMTMAGVLRRQFRHAAATAAAPGTGKTTSALRAAAGRALKDRSAVFLVDRKGDPRAPAFCTPPPAPSRSAASASLQRVRSRCRSSSRLAAAGICTPTGHCASRSASAPVNRATGASPRR